MRIITLACLAALTLGGCFFEYDSEGGYYYEDEYVYEYEYDYGYDHDLVVTSADLYGDLSYVQGFSGGVWIQEGYAYDGYTELTIESRSTYGESWAAMTQIEVDGGLTHPSFYPGAVYTFTGYGDTYYEADPFHIRVLGCSGPYSGEWVYDEYATQVDVAVYSGPYPGTVQVDFIAWFEVYDDYGYGEDAVYGSFTYEVW